MFCEGPVLVVFLMILEAAEEGTLSSRFGRREEEGAAEEGGEGRGRVEEAREEVWLGPAKGGTLRRDVRREGLRSIHVRVEARCQPLDLDVGLLAKDGGRTCELRCRSGRLLSRSGNLPRAQRAQGRHEERLVRTR